MRTAEMVLQMAMFFNVSAIAGANVAGTPASASPLLQRSQQRRGYHSFTQTFDPAPPLFVFPAQADVSAAEDTPVFLYHKLYLRPGAAPPPQEQLPVYEVTGGWKGREGQGWMLRGRKGAAATGAGAS